MPCALSVRVAVRAASTAVPLSIASRIFCEPDSTPSHTSSRPGRAQGRGGALGDQVDARLHHERHARVAPATSSANSRSTRGEPEDVVGEPDVVGRDVALQPAHLLGDVGGRALV